MGAVKSLFAPIGMGISFVAGILYVVISTEVIVRDNVIGGLIAGAVCALGPASPVSCALGDVTVVPILIHREPRARR